MKKDRKVNDIQGVPGVWTVSVRLSEAEGGERHILSDMHAFLVGRKGSVMKATKKMTEA